jgi:hypothetical protein
MASGRRWRSFAHLRFRLTDEVEREHERVPLWVSADRIAVTAMRCAGSSPHNPKHGRYRWTQPTTSCMPYEERARSFAAFAGSWLEPARGAALRITGG